MTSQKAFITGSRSTGLIADKCQSGKISFFAQTLCKAKLCASSLPFSNPCYPTHSHPEQNQQVAPSGRRAPPSPAALQESTTRLLFQAPASTLPSPFTAFLRFLKRPQWPFFGTAVTRYGGQAEEGGARGSRSFCLTEQMGASASPA